jgi:hypothetical protein
MNAAAPSSSTGWRRAAISCTPAGHSQYGTSAQPWRLPTMPHSTTASPPPARQSPIFSAIT